MLTTIGNEGRSGLRSLQLGRKDSCQSCLNCNDIAIEPMTAPANALISGRGLHLVEPGGLFRATFRVNVQEMP
jgi:hypothetical protein